MQPLHRVALQCNMLMRRSSVPARVATGNSIVVLDAAGTDVVMRLPQTQERARARTGPPPLENRLYVLAWCESLSLSLPPPSSLLFFPQGSPFPNPPFLITKQSLIDFHRVSLRSLILQYLLNPIFNA